MKADRSTIERALAKPEARCFLLYGPDEAGSRALADRLGTALGPGAERVDLDGGTLAKDPALLADEAASSSLFGGARYIRVRAAGDEVTDAVEALLSAPQAGNPVAIVAGTLKPASKLLKLVLASRDALAFASYLPEARDAVPLVLGLAQPFGLKIAPDIARQIFDGANGDRAVIAQELEKYALFLEASDIAPKPLDSQTWTAIGAGEGESSTGALSDAVLTGATRPATEELAQLRAAGEDGITLVRAMLRKLLQLAALRSEADRSSVSAALDGAGKSLFWRDKPQIEAELRRWSSAELSTLVSRMTAAQAALLASGSAGAVQLSQDLLTIARHAQRR